MNLLKIAKELGKSTWGNNHYEHLLHTLNPRKREDLEFLLGNILWFFSFTLNMK